MSCFVTLLPAVPYLTDLHCPSHLLVLFVMPKSWRMYCLWWTANGAKALSYSFGASADLTWRGLGMGRGCSGRKSLPFQLSCVTVGDRYFLCTLGELKGTELSRNTAVQATTGSRGPAGRGGPLTRRDASSMLLSLCIAFLKETPQC